MRFTLRLLTIAFKESTVEIPFGAISYFHGQMGAGKTSIARLADYCLGGSLDPSPALQSEFAWAELEVELKHAVLRVQRGLDSDRVIARWEDGAGPHQLSLPARRGAGVVLPGTEVENLSDLVFHLSGIVPPRVRTSKVRDDAELRRLSLRDLLWYCYLDQDEIDSTIFHLDKPNDAKQFKSRDVLRFILRFHNEQIAEIEAELERLRGQRSALLTSATALKRVLAEVGVESEGDLLARIESLQVAADHVQQQLGQIREFASSDAEYSVHAADQLRERARFLGQQVASIEAAYRELVEVLERERQHLGEVETLTLKFRRSNSAKEVLQGVSFVQCPRCAQPLPERAETACSVCGQPDETVAVDPVETLLVERDAQGRAEELREVIGQREAALVELSRNREELMVRKGEVERELAEVSAAYDSVYLANALVRERERASLLQQVADLTSMLRLPRLLEAQTADAERIGARETTLRSDLREVRARAERDASNLDRLKELFLDCLLRTGLPGISPIDEVRIGTKDFLPSVWGPEAIEATVTSFSNMSSGGKKTLFKCCFAVAVHRLAVEIGATLPELLIIDSPMKNISERENRQQFEKFHQMLYDLHAGELAGTQLVLIDKEYYAPPGDLLGETYERRMQPNEPGKPNPFPPLIPYYLGH